MKILQVSAADFGGGAAKVAWDLHNAYKAAAQESWLAVGSKRLASSDAIVIPNAQSVNAWESANFAVARETAKFIGRVKGAGKAMNFFNAAARYRNSIDYMTGREPFDYPGTKKLFSLAPSMPDILHCHNLHSKYFDLRELPTLSHQVPTVLTLHDTWLLSGHCAYAVTCERWKSGCGSCPDLTLYPAVRRDNTAKNWQFKREIYRKSKLYVVTPCAWLMNKVQASMLQDGVVMQKVIHNGVDTSLFCPGDRLAMRAVLGLDQKEFIVLFVANSVRKNIWKDYATLKQSLEILSALVPGCSVRALCFGDDGSTEYAGHIPIDFIPHTEDLNRLVQYYQAADLYVHATKADTFPTVILEALACGLPVLATAVDGVSEQVKPLNDLRRWEPFMKSVGSYDELQATGVLVERGDVQGLAHWLVKLSSDANVLVQLSYNARQDALERFDFTRQMREYLDWYENCRANFHTKNTDDTELKNKKEISHGGWATRTM